MKQDSPLAALVYKTLLRVPAGRVTTYKALAEACGTRGYRAVGQILHRNPRAPIVPCHRVVAADGRLNGYAFGLKKKAEILRSEGVTVTDDKVDLKEFQIRL